MPEIEVLLFFFHLKYLYSKNVGFFSCKKLEHIFYLIILTWGTKKDDFRKRCKHLPPPKKKKKSH